MRCFIFGIGLLCGCLVASAAVPATKPATGPTERFFSIEGIGQEILHEKLPAPVPEGQAAQLFTRQGSRHLASGWESHLPAGAVKPAADAKSLPDGPKFLALLVPPKNTEPLAHVAKFSDRHLIIRISKPAGDYLWHHYEDNLATLQVERNAELDRIFHLTDLEAQYATPYHGIVQGDAELHMIGVLGHPDSVRMTQAVDFHVALYEKGAVEIALWNGRVFAIRHVAADGTRP